MERMPEWFRNWWLGQSRTRTLKRSRSAFCIEPLERRIMPAVTASFSAAAGVLTVFGDSLQNSIERRTVSSLEISRVQMSHGSTLT